jgi:hypothetical protein
MQGLRLGARFSATVAAMHALLPHGGPRPLVDRRDAILGTLAAAIGTFMGAGCRAEVAAAPLDPRAFDGKRDLGDFAYVYGDEARRAQFRLFLANVFHLFPEGDFDALIAACVKRDARDPAVYAAVARELPSIAPTLGLVRYALPTLQKQKRVMAEQSAKLLGDARAFRGYLELGSHGRYLDALRAEARIEGPIFTSGFKADTSTPADIVDRGSFGHAGKAFAWSDYAPIAEQEIPSGSVELAAIFIGLHHAALEARKPFLASLHRVLAPGGRILLRDHDVTNDDLAHLVGLAHDVFNVGTEEPWRTNEEERRNFYSLDFLVSMMADAGFRVAPERLLQEGDPTRNTLMLFTKT